MPLAPNTHLSHYCKRGRCSISLVLYFPPHQFSPSVLIWRVGFVSSLGSETAIRGSKYSTIRVHHTLHGARCVLFSMTFRHMAVSAAGTHNHASLLIFVSYLISGSAVNVTAYYFATQLSCGLYIWPCQLIVPFLPWILDCHVVLVFNKLPMSFLVTVVIAT